MGRERPGEGPVHSGSTLLCSRRNAALNPTPGTRYCLGQGRQPRCLRGPQLFVSTFTHPSQTTTFPRVAGMANGTSDEVLVRGHRAGLHTEPHTGMLPERRARKAWRGRRGWFPGSRHLHFQEGGGEEN